MIRVLLSFCFIWEDIFIKHLRQCFISCPSTLNFIKNTLLQIVFQLSSHCVETLSLVLDILLQVPYHCFCRYATLENKPPAATFPKFPSVVRVIDRSNKFHQSQPLAWPSDLVYVMLAGCDWWISIRSVNNMHDWRKFWKHFCGCFVFESRVSRKKTVVSPQHLDPLYLCYRNWIYIHFIFLILLGVSLCPFWVSSQSERT